MNYSQRLNSVIPGGAHTYSRGDDQYSNNTPQILERGKGAYVYTPEKIEYLDYGMALRAVTLGYANDRINDAAIKQINNGVNLTRPSLIELEAAELFTSLFSNNNHMVKFAKNGSNVTTAAVKLARAYTGKKYVCIPKQHPFFSFDDWFIGSTPLKKGIPEEHSSLTLLFDYNNIESLKSLFDKFPNQIACVMLEPATTDDPCPTECSRVKTTKGSCLTCANKSNNFLHNVKKLCVENNSLFILDEMITGFRWDLPGAQKYFAIEPDLATFGKGMANGFSVAALVGRKEIMSLGGIKEEGLERTFLISTTHGAEMSSLGAFVETLKYYKEKKVIEHFWNYGEKLYNGFNEISNAFGLQEYVFMYGNYACMNYLTKNISKENSLEFRTLFQQEMVKNKVIFPWVAISYSHNEIELEKTLNAINNTLKVYKSALTNGIENFLEGTVIKPVFRKFN